MPTPAPPYFVGIKGATRESLIVAVTAEGEYIQHVRCGPLAPRINSDFSAAITDALLALSTSCGIPTIGQFARGCGGLAVAMSGITHQVDDFQVREVLTKIGMVGDFRPIVCEDVWADLASASVLAGMVVLASTGANAFVRTADERSVNVGGWGSDLSDKGGGYHLGHLALEALLDDYDGRTNISQVFRREILDALCLGDAAQIIAWYPAVRRTDYWRAKIADLAIPILRLAAEDDPTAMGIADSGIRELKHTLATAVNAAATQGLLADIDSPVPVVLSGGVARHSPLYNALLTDAATSYCARHNVAVRFADATLDTIAGAVYFALTSSKRRLPQLEVRRRVERSIRPHVLNVSPGGRTTA